MIELLGSSKFGMTPFGASGANSDTLSEGIRNYGIILFIGLQPNVRVYKKIDVNNTQIIEIANNEIDCYYNPENEEIFLSNIGEFKDLNEDELDELFEKSIMLPTRYDINEYEMMEKE